MPTSTGGETIAERLTRLREELTVVRATIDRTMKNGQTFGIRGTTMSQIAFDHVTRREAKLNTEIQSLENRLSNSGARSGLANLGSKSW